MQPKPPTSPKTKQNVRLGEADRLRNVEDKVDQLLVEVRRLSEAKGRGVTGIDVTPEKKKTVHIEARKSISDPVHQMSRDNAVSRQNIHQLRAERNDFFNPFITSDVSSLDSVKANWLLSITMCVSCLSKTACTPEMLLSSLHLPLYYLSLPSITHAELADISCEYLSNTNANRDHSRHIQCEMVSFDASILDESSEDYDLTGCRSPITSLSCLRKELSAASADPTSIYLFNVDPFIVEDHVIAQRELESDDESISQQKRQWSRNNMGACTILIDFNQALHTVTLGMPFFSGDGSCKVQVYKCNIQTLFQSCSKSDGYTRRPRGLLRFFLSSTHEYVTCRYPTGIVDGRDTIHGILSTAVDASIAPHVLGISMLHHFAQFELTGTCEGLALSEICQALCLPLSELVCQSSEESIMTAFAWYNAFLKVRGLHEKLFTAIIRIRRRDNADDGAPNVEEEQFLEHIQTGTARGNVMLIAFNLNIAHNAHIATESAVHFACVVGVNEQSGVILLADVNVKKYRKTWAIPLNRLYNATVGQGYVFVSCNKDIVDGIQPLCPDEIAEGSRKRYAVPLPVPLSLKSVDYGSKPYISSVIANALCLFSPQVRFSAEDVLYKSGFDLSFILSPRISLQDCARILRNVAGSSLSVGVVHTDIDNFASSFVAALQSKEMQVLVNYQSTIFQMSNKHWNGSECGGAFGVVANYDQASESVTIIDANPKSSLRVMKITVDFLVECMRAIDPISDRSGGFLTLESPQNAESGSAAFGSLRVFHPFKAPFSTSAYSIARVLSTQVGRAVSMEDVLYSSTFSISALALGADTAAITRIAKECCASLLPKMIVTYKPKEDFSDSQTLAKDLAVSPGDIQKMVVYDIQRVPCVRSSRTGAACAVISAVSGDNVRLLDGNPTMMGDEVSISVENLWEALLGVVQFIM